MSEQRKVIRIRDVMNEQVHVVDGAITVDEALERIQQTKVEALIIDKRHADDEFGIVLLADIARQVLARDKAPTRVNVYEIMSKPVVSVDPMMDIRYCARLFEKFGLSNAPVIDNDVVVGMVSYNDLVLKGMVARD
jgi:CBS domain-containing protein